MYDNLNNYKVFYVVASLGNISHAADVLYISQPAISKSIRNLEKGLGVSLFSRTSKGVSLTEEGELLYSHVKVAFEKLTKGEDELKRFNELGMGQLRIGVSTSLCKHILLDYLQDFIKKYPHIKVTIDCHSTVNTMKLLMENKIDVGLICETIIPKGYTYHQLKDIHDTFVASKSYLKNLSLRENEDAMPENSPWLIAGNITQMLDSASDKNFNCLDYSEDIQLSSKEILEKSNLMLLEKNNITRTHIDNYLQEEGIFPNQILEINNMDLLIDFASIGMGVSSVVREFAQEAISTGQIVEIKLDKKIKKRTVGFVYPEIKSKSTALNKFISFCCS